MSKPRTGAPKRVAVGLLAGALAMFGVALAPSAGATTTVTSSRLAGTTRYGTAAAIAGNTTFAAPTTAIVATGENYPDALAASSLAGASAPAPIILTQSATYTAEAKAGLAALKSKGVTAVTIVGGTSAVAQSVEDAIKADGFTTTRVAGADRFATAAAIATAANTKSPSAAVGGFKTALIATGNNFPDALAGGPAAYANKLPLLLVTDTVPQATKDAIASLGIKKAVILGGTAVVSDTVKAQLDTLTGNPSDRLAGTNRFGTAAAVGNYEITTLAFPATSAVLATGNNFPDALASGPLGGQNKAPIVLTASLPTESQAFLDAHSSTINKLFVAGGTNAIDDATVTAAQGAAQNTANDTGTNQTATTRPELVSASIVQTVTALNGTVSNPAGTTVTYTFDEPVTGAATAPGSFHLYRYSTPNSPLSATAATVSSTNQAVINAFYPALTTTDSNATTGTADITVATVDLAAVTDNQGQHNPEGDAAITGGTSTTITAGTTTAPDLQSVGRFGGTNTLNQSAVDFTFDQAAYVQSATTGFHLVLTDGLDVSCTAPGTATTSTTNPGGGSSPGGNGTTVITVSCGPVSAANSTVAGGGAASAANTTFFGAAPSATNVARGYVEAGAVGTSLAPAGGTLNPLEASNTPDAATTGPDLVSASFVAGTTADSVVYTFDESVLGTGLVGTNFRVYTSTGSEVAASNTAVSGGGFGLPTRNTDNTAQVAVFFAPGTLANAVGANVLAGAVSSASGSNKASQPDEVGATGTATATTTAGATVGPDLTSVLLVKTNNSFGQLSSTTVIYTFDKQVTNGTTPAPTTTPANYLLYLSDGTRLVCAAVFTNATASFSALPNTSVACGGYVFGATGEAGTNTAGGTATAAQIANAVLGTVNNAAVSDSSGNQNPEGAANTAGGNGTPAS